MDDTTATAPSPAAFRPSTGECRWEGVEEHAYKEEGSAPFRAITRRILFGDPRLSCELRYFEVAPGGYSTLERHEHVHGVMILRGAGTCLVGEEVRAVALHDLVSIPPMAWHQFRAATTRSPRASRVSEVEARSGPGSVSDNFSHRCQRRGDTDKFPDHWMDRPAIRGMSVKGSTRPALRFPAPRGASPVLAKDMRATSAISVTGDQL